MFGFASAVRAAQERTRIVTTPIASMVGFASIHFSRLCGWTDIRELVPAVVIDTGTWVTGLFHPLVELRSKLLSGAGIARLFGGVDKLMGVLAQVVQFFWRPFAACQAEEAIDLLV